MTNNPQTPDLTITQYGYARVSSVGQDLTIQVQKLNEVGCDVMREEKVSGTSLRGRTEFETLMEFMREGDELVVTRIDRLAPFNS